MKVFQPKSLTKQRWVTYRLHQRPVDGMRRRAAVMASCEQQSQQHTFIFPWWANLIIFFVCTLAKEAGGWRAGRRHIIRNVIFIKYANLRQSFRFLLLAARHHDAPHASPPPPHLTPGAVRRRTIVGGTATRLTHTCDFPQSLRDGDDDGGVGNAITATSLLLLLPSLLTSAQYDIIIIFKNAMPESNLMRQYNNVFCVP